MKDQYFGDARDYFKYHLLVELVRRVPGLEKLVCLWMLTPGDTSGEGNVRFTEYEELPELTAFLHRHLKTGDRRVRHMREFFLEQGVSYVPWEDEPPHFTGPRRKDYFAQIPDKYLQQALVYFDPDIGLTIGKPSPQHLALEELATIYARMDSESLAVIYQHRARRRDFWNSMALEIEAKVKGPVRWVADSAVAFFVVPKTTSRLAVIEEILSDVAGYGRSRSVGSPKATQ